MSDPATTPAGKARLYSVLLLASLAMVAFWAWGEMDAADRSAQSAQTSLTQTRTYAGHLLALQSSTGNEPNSGNGRELSAAVETAAQTAKIVPGSIKHITTSKPQRIGTSAFAKEPTHIRLDSVTPHQLATMLHALLTAQPQQTTQSIRLHAPQNAKVANTFHADITLIRTLYLPKGK
jgi:hypothetical protein